MPFKVLPLASKDSPPPFEYEFERFDIGFHVSISSLSINNRLRADPLKGSVYVTDRLVDEARAAVAASRLALVPVSESQGSPRSYVSAWLGAADRRGSPRTRTLRLTVEVRRVLELGNMEHFIKGTRLTEQDRRLLAIDTVTFAFDYAESPPPPPATEAAEAAASDDPACRQGGPKRRHV